jgi:hypothetical protein
MPPRGAATYGEIERTMTRGEKGRTWWIVTCAVCCLLLAPSGLRGYEKKLRVVTDYTHVYLQPDEGSPVVDTLERGAVLSLLYGGKMKKVWYYICFKSEKTGVTKSGYVIDSEVELLFDPVKTITIQEEQESLRVQYPPRKFDEMHWGSTKKQIVDSEGKPAAQTRVKGGDILAYKQKMFNLDCDIEYSFAANKLKQTRFSFANDSLDKNDYLDDYRKIKDALIRRFGKPVSENMNWRDNSCKEDFSAWGEAVGLGQLELTSRWLTPQTEILASLAGRDEKISLVVLFRGVQVRELARRNQGDD